MGYVRHHAMIVVGFEDARVLPAHAKAVELGLQVSKVITTKTNAYVSFYVSPDGSKEGWEESDAGDARRDALIAWIKKNPKLYLDWVEVEMDVDGERVRIPRDNISKRKKK